MRRRLVIALSTAAVLLVTVQPALAGVVNMG